MVVMPESYVPCSIFVLAPGAFFVLAALTAIQNKIKIAGEKKGKDMFKIQSGCNSDCMSCGESGCSRRLFPESVQEVEPEKPKVKATSVDDLIENDLVVEEITDDGSEEKEEEKND